ncbi:endothelial cell-specific chemotaxis regulator [Colossoma macropomum]|uniref:endothelial cell-specific chemotaxis regulator n=1 Tax=Colossoma macropomum TaxID=42526 RepID=UPI001863CE1F|nr:endothelial cell-specific chemotaxis regulator [Colossoma macropomum]
MDLLLCSFIVFCVSLSFISAATPSVQTTQHATTVMTSTTSIKYASPTANFISTQYTEGSSNSSGFNVTSPPSSAGQTKLVSPTSAGFTSHMSSNMGQITSSPAAVQSDHDPGPVNFTNKEAPTAAPPTQPPSNSLTMLAFGVMSFILILIIVMVILVTAVNLRGRCNNTKEEGVKGYDSVISESNMTSTGEKESITLVSIRTINTETDSDSPQISSVRSTILDNEDQELSRDLLSIRAQ